MIDPAQGLSANIQQKSTAESTETRRVLTMVKNERMGGYVPKWETVTTTKKQGIEQNLADVQAQKTGDSFKSTLAYHNAQEASSAKQDKEFGFGDLIDMVNPLHHIPVVGHLYRNITGDEIKSVGKIIGGAVFGGPVGAAVGLVNMVVEEETGKDITGSALAMVLDGETPKFKNDQSGKTEQILNDAVQIAEKNDLPGALLSFTDLGHQDGFSVKKVSAADGRTAGSFMKKSHTDMSAFPLTNRDPITEVILKAMPDTDF